MHDVMPKGGAQWTDRQQGTDVRLWRLDGSDHYPEFSWAFTERTLNWALSHPRP